jgi:short-subunit dehydrogenase
MSAGCLELFVNNAGFGTCALFFRADVEGQDQMHRLHVVATMRLTHAAFSGMVCVGRVELSTFIRGRVLAVAGECQLLRHQMLDEQLY